LKILTNVDLPATWRAWNGEEGQCIYAKTPSAFVSLLPNCDLVIINAEPNLLMQLSAAMMLRPLRRRPLLGSDTVLRKPSGVGGNVNALAKRFLLSRVDHFMNSFRDVSGYSKYFGITPEKCSFVPFKPNLRYRCEAAPNSDGEYVLCLGWSMRDYDTFFDAMDHLPYPAAIAKPNFEQLASHGSRFTRPLSQLSDRVKVLDHEPRDYASQVQILMGAKLVVVPLLKSCLVQTGTPYNAMLLGKCVIVSDGPAVRGIFTDEVLPVPPEDPVALAKMIDGAWKNAELREKVAAAGHRSVLALGGEPEFAQRLIDQAVRWYRKVPTPENYRCFI
jgi:glycosyltransferase involved in cell wall biosynthesis